MNGTAKRVLEQVGIAVATAAVVSTAGVVMTSRSTAIEQRIGDVRGDVARVEQRLERIEGYLIERK